MMLDEGQRMWEPAWVLRPQGEPVPVSLKTLRKRSKIADLFNCPLYEDDTDLEGQVMTEIPDRVELKEDRMQFEEQQDFGGLVEQQDPERWDMGPDSDSTDVDL